MSRATQIALKVLAWGLVGVVTLVVLAVGAVLLLVGTERGAQWTADRFLPDELAVERLEGRLLGPLTVHGLEFRGDDGAVTEVDRVHLEWSPRALWSRRAHVRSLEVTGVRHTMGEDEEEVDEVDDLEELPEIHLPVAVDVERARVTDVTLRDVDGAEAATVDELVLRAHWTGSTVRLWELSVEAPEGVLRAEGSADLAGDYPLDLAVDWEATLPDQPAMAGFGTFEGSLADLEVQHRLERPAELDLAARVRDVVTDLTWEAEVDAPRFDLGQWDEEWAGNEVGLQATASGSLEAVEGQASLEGAVEALEGPGEVEAFVEGAYGDDRVTLAALDVELPDVDGRLSATGDVLLEEPLTLDVQGEWADLAWPPIPDPDVASPEGRFSVDGTLEDYAFDAQMALEGPDIPPGWWSVEGTGSSSDATLQLAGDVLDGNLRAGGSVAWDPEPAWDLTVEADELNPEEIHPEAEGWVTLRAASQGRILDDGPHTDVLVEQLEGELDDESFSLQADVGVEGDALDVRALEISAFEGEWTAFGTVDQEWNMEVTGEAPDLAALEGLVEAVEGSLEVEARLTGPREEPEVAGRVEARDVSAFDVEVGVLDLYADVSELGARPSSVELRVEELATPGASLAGLELDARGTRQDHEVTLGAQGLDGASRELAVAGGLDEEGETPAWSGMLDQLAILGWSPADLDVEDAEGDPETPVGDLGDWTLEAPTPLHASAEGAGVERLCLRDGQQSLCLGGDWAEGVGGDVFVNAAELPLERASPWLPDVDVEGALSVDAEVALDGDAAPVTVLTDVRSTPGSLSYRPGQEDAPDVVREFREVHAHVDWADGILDAGLVLDFAEEGDDLRGSIRMEGADPAEGLEGATLEGELAASLEDRGLAGLFLPELEGSRGALFADLQVEGTVEEPRAFGRVGLEEAGAAVVPAGIEVEDLGLALSSDDGSLWEATGGARSGDGELTFGGFVNLDEAAPGVAEGNDGSEATPANPVWDAELTVEGEGFEAFNTTDARVVIAPDLEIQGGPERMDVGGRVAVPQASITPGEMEEGVVQASPDVVVVGHEEDPAEQATPMDLHAEVTVELGDDVTIDAFGLTGRLTGGLTVVEGPDQVTTGRGELEVVEGEFTMYGQTLAVDRGRLIFADGPVDEPGLDIRVSREVEEIVVGLDIGGTAARPEGEVFSEPAMAEADALSYLVLGRPLRQTSPEEGDVLADAARSAGLAGAGRLAEQLGVGVFGLEEAYIDPGEGDGLEEAQLVVGAQITPSIHVGYALGLFEAGNILRVRYNLGRQWTIRTEAGEETGGDLFYTIER